MKLIAFFKVTKKKMMGSLLLFVLMVLILVPGSSFGASFDCAKAATKTEHLICDNPGLSQMDDLLQVLYQRAKEQTKAPKVLRAVQRSWIKERNQICGGGDAAACEQSYVDGYGRLIDYYHTSLNPLSDGMLLPDSNQFKPGDYDNYDDISLSYAMDQIWKQKVLLTIDNADVSRLLATRVGDTPYLIYLLQRSEQVDSYQYEIHELNVLTEKDLIIASGSNDNWRYGMDTDLFAVRDGALYFPPFNVDNPQGDEVVLRYQIGSSLPAEEITLTSLGETLLGLRSALYGVWPGSQTIATLASSSFLFDQASELDEMRDFFADKQNNPGDDGEVLIYSFDENYGYPLNFEKNGRGGWAVGSLVFDDLEPILYFDNSGPVACIWTYNLDNQELMKIVPQHGAVNPAPFKYQGNNYVAFSMVSYKGKDQKQQTVSIFLASGDLYRLRW